MNNLLARPYITSRPHLSHTYHEAMIGYSQQNRKVKMERGGETGGGGGGGGGGRGGD